MRTVEELELEVIEAAIAYRHARAQDAERGPVWIALRDAVDALETARRRLAA